MKIKLHEFSIREIQEGYVDNYEEGVLGFGGKLNIRPKYQREFVYDNKKRAAVIESIQNGFPLNVMYWVKNNDGSFGLLDGQQRTISFCQYIKNEYSIENKIFKNLTVTEQQQILDYKLMIYICEGNDKEQLDWFRIINISGEKLTEQELRNAVYTGTWLTSAKSIFSKSNCAAYLLAKNYVKGSPLRQELLETSLKWINAGNIEGYMSKHQHDPNANELWMYFKNVIEWVAITFKYYRPIMNGINWGYLYDKYNHLLVDTEKIEKEIETLILDDDVTKKQGVYYYVFERKEKYLYIREFSNKQKIESYTRQKGICALCKEHFDIKFMEADHITPWVEGGKTNADNCQMLCRECNRRKSNK